MKDNKSIQTLNEKSKDQTSDSSVMEPSKQNKNHENTTLNHQNQRSYYRKRNIKKQSKKRQGRKSRNFTIQEDQKLLQLILKLGPKFKTIQRKMSGRPLNILKNRYYRDLRYRWDDVLGMEFAYLNEKKLDITTDEMWMNSPFDPDLSKIMMNMVTQLQNVFKKCLN